MMQNAFLDELRNVLLLPSKYPFLFVLLALKNCSNHELGFEYVTNVFVITMAGSKIY